MRRFISLFLSLTLLLSISAGAAFDNTGLMWDGKPSALSEIGSKLGYSLADYNGNYIPQYYDEATQLWEQGLLLGSEGSFNLDRRMTRLEGVVMAVRLLGKEAEAKSRKLTSKFTDVPDWAKDYVGYAVNSGIASGYSQTKFGSDDDMTASQFLTFVLRAMGYVDNVDFVWDAAADKALEIGLIGQACHAQYTRSNLFLRDNMAAISYNALYSAPMKAGGLLIDSITTPGRPSGQLPSAMAASAVQSVKGGIKVEIRQESEYTSFVSEGGRYVNGILMKGMSNDWVSLTVISGSGTITLTEVISGVTASRSIYVEQGQTCDITPLDVSYYTLILSGETYELTAGVFYYPA